MVGDSRGLVAAWKDLQVTTLRSHVPDLKSQGGRDRILHRQVAAQGVGSLVVELNSKQGQPIGVNLVWNQRSAGETHLKCDNRSVASGNRRGRGIVRRVVMELELVRIAFADIRRVSAVFKTVVEEAKSAAYNQFWTGLVGKAYARRKIGPLGMPKSGAVMIRDEQADAVLRQQSREAITDP